MWSEGAGHAATAGLCGALTSIFMKGVSDSSGLFLFLFFFGFILSFSHFVFYFSQTKCFIFQFLFELLIQFLELQLMKSNLMYDFIISFFLFPFKTKTFFSSFKSKINLIFLFFLSYKRKNFFFFLF